MQSRAAGRPAETEQHNKNNPLTVLSSGTKTASLSVTSRPEQLATLMAHHGPAGLLLRRLPLQHFTALSTAIIQQTATRSNRAAAPELQTDFPHRINMDIWCHLASMAARIMLQDMTFKKSANLRAC